MTMAMQRTNTQTTDRFHSYSNAMLTERIQDTSCVSFNPHTRVAAFPYTQKGAVKREQVRLSWPQRNQTVQS